MLITEQVCGPNKDWVQFFSGDTDPKKGEGTVDAYYREAFRKLIEARYAEAGLPLAKGDDNEKK